MKKSSNIVGREIQTIVLIEAVIIPGMDGEGKGREGRKS
jgi:hypothetical protein